MRMKVALKQIIQRLSSKQNRLNQIESLKSVNSDFSAENKDADMERCSKILNYWLDIELFDLPECPVYNKKDVLSIPADDFKSVLEGLDKQYREGNLKITKDSRLLVMFQCHRAGYITEEGERHPNYQIPRTYLVAQALVPTWYEPLQCMVWNRSEDDADLIVNSAAMRTLYRKSRPVSAQNMSLSDWIESRNETIKNLLELELQATDSDSFMTSELLGDKFKNINRKLANEFWPDDTSKAFMFDKCQSLESLYQEDNSIHATDEKTYSPIKTPAGDVTFRWRFCFYPESSEKNQLGPFFVKDLEHCIASLQKHGSAGLSKPLQRYLLSEQEKVEIKQATNNGAFFHSITNKPVLGRWPENPKYGLSLLQSVAVNIALDLKRNPLVAVNGPPGTGKTTLLKDIIATNFVQRTLKLSRYISDENWLDKPEFIDAVMQHSMVVASSNNKAVENISKELPASNKIYEGYRDLTAHFNKVSSPDTWGIFCAVLGNSDNRKAFKSLLKKLGNHLKKLDDYFELNPFCTALDSVPKNEALTLIQSYFKSLEEDQKLGPLARDILGSHAAKKNHKNFLEPFAGALQKIETGELTLDSFVQTWASFNEEQWLEAKAAILTFKKQWFGAKKFDAYFKARLENALTHFVYLYKALEQQDIQSSEYAQDSRFLTKVSDYNSMPGEALEDTEARLQQSSPIGFTQLNDLRSKLFIAALRLNEAMIESVGKKLVGDFSDIELLIDGRLETKEKLPEHQKLWSKLFLFFPVVSTSLSSTENQFKLMQKSESFGLAMFDEAGQAVNYHVVGLLQRSRQAIFVGDPIQLEPVVSIPHSIDIAIAEGFLPLSRNDEQFRWGDHYLVTGNSAQEVADRACRFFSQIGERRVGIPLLVHRRCTEPMFGIANKIAYDEKMVNASSPFGWEAIPSGWINISETEVEIGKRGYINEKEARTAIEIVRHLAESNPDMLRNGVYIITPFTLMQRELKRQWKNLAKDQSNHHWMALVSDVDPNNNEFQIFADNNIGTVHTFQGKEASTVILCCAASSIRQKTGGISWVNSKPNLINVAVTRAKHHLFVLGNASDWANGNISSELQAGGMKYYESFESWCNQEAKVYDKLIFKAAQKNIGSKQTFNF